MPMAAQRSKAQVGLDVKEELGDGAVGTGINLAFEVEQIRLCAARFRVPFRVGGHRNIEVRFGLEQGHQIGGIHLRPLQPLGQVTAQRHDMADAAVPVIAGNGAQLVAAGVDTGQVRGGDQTGPLLDVLITLCVRSRVPELAP